MTKEQALKEISSEKVSSETVFWLTVVSCVLLGAGLLGFVLFREYWFCGLILFISGAVFFALTVLCNILSKKRKDDMFIGNFIIPELEKYFSDIVSESKLPVSVESLKKLGFFKNLQWTAIDGNRSFSVKLDDKNIKFCELGIYNLFSVPDKEHKEKSVTERDYIFRGRYFEIEGDVPESDAENLLMKTERYQLCNKGVVRAEYKGGKFYIFHNINSPEEEFDYWLRFPKKKNVSVSEVEEKVRKDIEPYITMIRYIF